MTTLVVVRVTALTPVVTFKGSGTEHGLLRMATLTRERVRGTDGDNSTAESQRADSNTDSVVVALTVMAKPTKVVVILTDTYRSSSGRRPDSTSCGG